MIIINVSEINHKTRHWNAYWIWENGHKKEENSYYYFRKTFHMDSVSGIYKLYITAETFYKVYINGKYIGTGPVFSQPYFKYYDVYQIKRN